MVRKYAETLSATTAETLERIKAYEVDGRFHDHPDGMLTPDYMPVDAGYVYLPRNPLKKLARLAARVFVVRPFMRQTNRLFRTEVRGRQYLKGINGAIVCCNHVNKLDCMAVCRALKGKSVYTTAAEFNNMRGFLGDMMRAGGMLPLSGNYAAMKHLDGTIGRLLKRGSFITFFPEGSEWWGYEKPRPQLAGAYRYAVKYGVPVVPVFITFRPTAASEASETGLKQFVVNILPPVYADAALPRKQAALKMRDSCAALWEKAYASFYGASGNLL